MDKNEKEAGTKDDTTTAQETATRPGETEEKSGQESGTDAEGHEDTGLDQGGETPATGGQGLSDREITKDLIEEVTENIMKEVYESAKKVFARNDVERLWFTVDGCGFCNKADASAHAETLMSKDLLEINRKDFD